MAADGLHGMVGHRRAALLQARRAPGARADAWHGTGGPLVVSDVADKHEIPEAFIRACNDLGYPTNPDFNGATQEGVGYHQTTTVNGKRCSTAEGYLHPVMDRPNLRVITGALAQRITFRASARPGSISSRTACPTPSARAAR